MEIILIIILLFFSALFSGLTIGLLGLNRTELKRKAKLGDKRAIAITKIRENGNLLLVTLLIGNVAVNSILSVFLGQNFSGIVAVLISTILIVSFGEILPQAIFYRYALSVGYYFVPIIKFFIIIFYPIAWPISKFLDKILGNEKDTVWTKQEIKEIIKDHEDFKDSAIDSDEEDIVLGALSFSEKKAKQIMTPKNVTFMLEKDTFLDEELLEEIKQNGFTRVLIFSNNKDNIIGVLNVKKLINLPENKKVSDIYDKGKILEVKEEERLDNLLNFFIKKKVHIAFVVNVHKTFLGIVTLEDIIEEIISKEIMDETDKHEDMREVSNSVNNNF